MWVSSAPIAGEQQSLASSPCPLLLLPLPNSPALLHVPEHSSLGRVMACPHAPPWPPLLCSCAARVASGTGLCPWGLVSCCLLLRTSSDLGSDVLDMPSERLLQRASTSALEGCRSNGSLGPFEAQFSAGFGPRQGRPDSTARTALRGVEPSVGCPSRLQVSGRPLPGPVTPCPDTRWA